MKPTQDQKDRVTSAAKPSGAKYDVFISYRRDGGDQTALLIHQELIKRGYRVFFDIHTLGQGDYSLELKGVIESCKDFLLILPPQALDRCAQPQDWLRREIEWALASEKNIIPILLRGFAFPDELPESISAIRTRNGLNPNSEYFDAYIDKLCTFLKAEPHPNVPNGKPRRRWVFAAALAAAVLAAGIFLLPGLLGASSSGSSLQYKQPATAVGLYNQMLEKENGDKGRANYDVAYAYYYGSVDVQPDEDLALDYAIAAGKLKNASGMLLAGIIYQNRKDYTSALAWYQKGMEAGNAKCTYMMGVFYEKAYGVTQDLAAAKKYYQKASDKGLAEATSALERFK